MKKNNSWGFDVLKNVFQLKKHVGTMYIVHPYFCFLMLNLCDHFLSKHHSLSNQDYGTDIRKCLIVY